MLKHLQARFCCFSVSQERSALEHRQRHGKQYDFPWGQFVDERLSILLDGKLGRDDVKELSNLATDKYCESAR